MGYETKIPQFNRSFDKQNMAFLKAAGSAMETGMKKRCPVGTKYGGTLRQDISFNVVMEQLRVDAGNTLDYSVYVNKGTGVFSPQGRKTPWVYYDPKTGEYYRTHGQPAQPYLEKGFGDIKAGLQGLYKKIMGRLK